MLVSCVVSGPATCCTGKAASAAEIAAACSVLTGLSTSAVSSQLPSPTCVAVTTCGFARSAMCVSAVSYAVIMSAWATVSRFSTVRGSRLPVSPTCVSRSVSRRFTVVGIGAPVSTGGTSSCRYSSDTSRYLRLDRKHRIRAAQGIHGAASGHKFDVKHVVLCRQTGSAECRWCEPDEHG